MNEEAEPSADGKDGARGSDDGAPWWVWAFLVGGGAALGVSYAWLRTSRHIEWHASIGTSLEPVASFLSLFAVVGALWSVHVQRRELELQRQELRDNRREMREQRREFERTARAQERLANAQLLAGEASCRVGMNATMTGILSRIDDPESAKGRELRASIDANGRRLSALATDLSGRVRDEKYETEQADEDDEQPNA